MESSIWVANVLRIIPIIMGALLAGLTIRVVQLYYQAYRKELGLRDRRGDGHHRGVVPLYVWSIGTSHLLLVLYATYTQLGRIGLDLQPLDYALAVGGLATSLYALLVILKFERRRVELAKTRSGQLDAAAPPSPTRPPQHEAQEDSREVLKMLTRGAVGILLVVLVAASLVTFGRVLDVAEQNDEIQELLESETDARP